MEMPAHIWHLIARNLNGEASEREKLELGDALVDDPTLQQQFEILSRIWKEKAILLEQEEDDVSAKKVISRIINKAEAESAGRNDEQVNHRSNRGKWLIAASVLALAIATWTVLKPRTGVAKEKEASIVAQNGSRIRSLLPDGTVVWLNAGSHLTYADFSGPTREVQLEGEAYFDVVKQTDRPFIVHTSAIDIKVLGTAFNVKAYPEDKNVETTLIRGEVLVLRKNEPESSAVKLKPNEKLLVSKEAAIPSTNLSQPRREKALNNPAAGLTITLIDSTRKDSERFETAWLYSRLEFRGENFETLARKLERWYNVKIIFMTEKVRQLNFNGSFEKETVDQAFKALKAAVPFEYNIKGNEIFVRSPD